MDLPPDLASTHDCGVTGWAVILCRRKDCKVKSFEDDVESKSYMDHTAAV